jgi:energy-coupling factor transporter ATP-binding protein EcfA2
LRLCKFEIANFKGIENACFEWDDIAVLIGENNAGKSTVTQALEWFLGGSQIKDPELFFDHKCDEGHAIELVGHFDQLTPQEKQAVAVQGRMNGELWVIKKRFWAIMDEENGESLTWKETYHSFSSEEQFAGWPEEDNSWDNFPTEYKELIPLVAGKGKRPSSATREALQTLIRAEKPALIVQSPAKWVPNPGGGGNWKSNANSIIPRFIAVRAVQDASDEATSKESSAYGKIVSLIVERKLSRRTEIVELKQKIEAVLRLFRPDPEHPELQAAEIRDIQDRINRKLNEVVGGVASIRTTEPDLHPILLPSTTLVLKDCEEGLDTPVRHQGHGLQRTLIMTLVQILAEVQSEPEAAPTGTTEGVLQPRPVILAIEEPELYMHPQMERKMRDSLYRLSSQNGFQVICTTHSPVFLDMAQRHKAIVRVCKDSARRVTLYQVSSELFEGKDAEAEKDRLRLIANFNPTVNEVFFSKRVVLMEEQTAVSAFERAAELTGIFDRHRHVLRDVTLVDCRGKGNIPAFQQVLNHFGITYTVIHDEDKGNEQEQRTNDRIKALLSGNSQHMVGPTDIEGLLGYAAAGRDKPYGALKRVEELHEAKALPLEFLRALNWVYFGADTEPTTASVIPRVSTTPCAEA